MQNANVIERTMLVLGGATIGAITIVAIGSAFAWREFCHMSGGSVFDVTREMVDGRLFDFSERQKAVKAVKKKVSADQAAKKAEPTGD